MPLKFELETLDGVPEPLKEHYVKSDETNKFVLAVDGVVPKAKLDEFRGNNITLVKERDALQNTLKAFGDLTPERALEMSKTLESIKDKKVLDDEGVEALIQKRLEKLNEDHESQIRGKDNLINNLNQRTDTAERRFRALVINQAVADAALKAGVKPQAITDVLLRAQQIWTLDDKERPVAKLNGEVQYGRDGASPMTPLEWLEGLKEDAPHFFESSGGGGASGANGAGGAGAGKIKSKADLKSAAEKAKFIRDKGYNAFVELPNA